jgi:hypothetical protein
MRLENLVPDAAGILAHFDRTPDSLGERLPHRERTRIGSVSAIEGPERQRVTLLFGGKIPGTETPRRLK